MNSSCRIKIGVDFDNTIVSYDELMHDIAMQWGLIPADVEKSKKIIRDTIRRLPDGETHWRELQIESYGRRMCDARMTVDIGSFFRECVKRKISVCIVSHKTEYPNIGPADVNLRSVAIDWLEMNGFFDLTGIGLERKSVFFESTRGEKISRIKALRLTHFIDDLEETFSEKSFPPEVEKILYAPHGKPTGVEGVREFAAWGDICNYFFADPIPHAGLLSTGTAGRN